MNELLTLMISSELARVEGRDQSAAIQRTASIVRRETRDRQAYDFATKLAGRQTPADRIAAVVKLQHGLIAVGYL
jgi:hypothetical protein